MFSHLADALSLGLRPPAIHWDYLAYHLTCHFLRGEACGLEGVFELLPGAERTYSSGGSTERFYWDPHDIAGDRHGSEAESQHALRAAGEAAITAYGSLYRRIALDLSGGLDSSIVLGLLRGACGHADVVGVNYVTAHPEGDERAYARQAAAMHGVPLLERELSLHGFDSVQTFGDRLLRPSSRMMPMGYDQLHSALLGEIGADAFFTGSGGDHLFAVAVGPEAVADHGQLLGLGGLGRRAHEIANLSQGTIWGVLGRAAAAAIRPPGPSLGDVSCLSAEVQAHVDPARFTHPWLSARRGTPPGKVQQIAALAELYRHYWRYGRADVAEEAHPLFSQPVMEACLRTPTFHFIAGGRQRGLARNAFGDLLPSAIRERRSKGANTSHWVRTMASDLPRVRALLLDGELSRRGWLDRGHLEKTLTPSGLVENARLSSLVTCLTTELWIQGMSPVLGDRPAPTASPA
ncbi:asparagine synthase-related protein [Phenylobacterium sp. LjRoot164]|uniref:asparagine synthase-related protein n=1 Tax=unclassified Phenylobacterium TaxID=2640670 RepID=UPI003ED09B04